MKTYVLLISNIIVCLLDESSLLETYTVYPVGGDHTDSYVVDQSDVVQTDTNISVLQNRRYNLSFN